MITNNYLKIKYKLFFNLVLLIFFLEIYNLKLNDYSKNNRILIYTCCDEEYSHYIPIFCNLLLRADKYFRIDIEIGVSLNKLSNNEEKALQYLKDKYNNSKILIKYNFFKQFKKFASYKNKKMPINCVRFISKTKIKNKYIYIIDIDLLILKKNFYIYLIDDMIKRKSCYSNIVRSSNNALSGLHFILYDKYYPIPKQKEYNIVDENLLYNIVKSKGIIIDNKTQFRPVFGIHPSPSRPKVEENKLPGWNAENYKKEWIEYINSSDFIFIKPLLHNSIKKKILLLNEFYEIKNKD